MIHDKREDTDERSIARAVSLMAAHGYVFSKLLEWMSSQSETPKTLMGGVFFLGGAAIAGMALAFTSLQGGDKPLSRKRRNDQENLSFVILGFIAVSWLLAIGARVEGDPTTSRDAASIPSTVGSPER